MAETASQSPAPSAAPRPLLGRGRWGVAALLLGATLLNYLDRQTLGVLAPLIRAEMKLDLAQLGALFSVFYWAYAASQVLVGPVLDRVGVRRAYAVAVAAWSLAGAAAGLATGFVALLALRFLLGVCEAANWPAALRVVSRTFAPGERSLASGIFQSGTSIGALVAPALLIAAATAFGWRAGFVATGLAGLLWVALWLRFFRPVGEGGGGRAAPGQGAPGRPALAPLGPVLRSRRLWGLVLASSFLNPVLYFYVNWLPTYFVESGQSFGTRLASLLVASYLALDLGYLAGGALVAWLARRRDVVAARRRVVGLGVPLMAAIVLVPALSSVYAVTAVIAAACFGLGCVMVSYLAFVTEVSHERVSTVAGMLGAAGSVAGAVFMWLVGVLTARSGFALPFFILGAMPFVTLAGIWIATAGPRPGAAAPEAGPFLSPRIARTRS